MPRQVRASFAIAVLAIIGSAAWPLAQPDSGAQLELSTYFGGTGAETVTAVRADAKGNIYVAGSTRSADLLTVGSLFASPRDGLTVGFLTKLRADGFVVYSTYLERPVMALAVDAEGNAIVADHLYAGNKFSGPTGDVVVTKIDAAAATVVYSVRLGGIKLDEVGGIAVDATGAVVVTGQTTSADFPLLNALQPTVRSSASWPAESGAFITKLDAQGRMIFSTGWGGSGADAGRSVAIDHNLDIVVAGTTASTDFVTTPGAFQRTLAGTSCTVNGIACRDAFVTRLSADGQTVRYSTLFGGTEGETVNALALDNFGSPHIAGVTASPDLPLRQSLQTTCDSPRQLVNGCSTYVTKLSADGSSLQYSMYFGSQSYYVYGPGQIITGLSVDATGNLVAVGTTQGNDLPLVRAFQSINGSGPLFKSSDDGATWVPSGSGMVGTGVWHMTSAGRRSPLYAGPLGGRVFRSEDHGGIWRGARSGTAEPGTFAVDSLTASILYGTSASGLLKSVDGGESWSRPVLEEPYLMAVAVAPSSPSNVYASGLRGVFHSANGGLTWSHILETKPADGAVWPHPNVQSIAVHPQIADAVYAMMSDGSIARRESGRQWRAIGSLQCPANQLVFAGGLPTIMYARACGKVWKSTDEGQSWRSSGFADQTAAWIALDPSMPHAVYVASAHNGVFRSLDRGETWTMIREPLDQDIRSILVDPSVPGTIYIGATGASNAFVAKFNPAGMVTLASYLGGLKAAGSSIAVDRTGAIIVAGTAGREFPQVQSIQKRYAGAVDAFVARILNP